MKQRLTSDQATQWYRRAQDRLRNGPATKESAALWAYHAVSLEPNNPDIQRFFNEICNTHRLRFGPSNNPKVLELEKVLETEPETPGVLRQLAQLYRLEGNIYRAVVYLKRYLQLRPKDGYAATQLLQMTGENPLPRGVGLRTNELVAGIRTGGFRAVNQPVAAAPSGDSSPQSSENPLADTPSSLGAQLWSSVGKKLLVAACVVAALVFVVKRVNGAIDSATHESTQASDALARARESAESVRLNEQSRRAMEQSSESNAREAARMLDTARAALNKENYAEAISGFETLIQHHPKRPEAVTAKFLRAKALLASDQKSKAIVALTEYIDQYGGSTEYWEALLRRGQAYHLQLEDALAASDLDQLLQKQPTSPWAAEALVVRGEIHARRGQKEDAAADFRAALGRTGPSDQLNVRASNGLKELDEK
jgi:tetratricopeptide (TPR) repeat protein